MNTQVFEILNRQEQEEQDAYRSPARSCCGFLMYLGAALLLSSISRSPRRLSERRPYLSEQAVRLRSINTPSVRFHIFTRMIFTN